KQMKALVIGGGIGRRFVHLTWSFHPVANKRAGTGAQNRPNSLTFAQHLILFRFFNQITHHFCQVPGV
ncbi:hypothetical protein V7P28_13430, partial [Klebsiella michiganensis]